MRDDKGSALAGIAVSFSVDSGGGTLQSTGATTAADGSASPGRWTLGSAEGRNVLVARVGSLAPAKLVAVSRVQNVVFSQPGAGAAAETGYVETAFRAILGANCPDPSFRQTLTLSSSTVTGEVTDLQNNPDEVNVPGGSITATRPAARLLQGSFVWKARYSTGIATYRVNFQAALVVPP